MKNFRYIKVPREFLKDSALRRALLGTADSFGSDEQTAIFMYYYIGLSLKDISEITRLPRNFLFCLMLLYSEKLRFKLRLLKNKSPQNVYDLIPITEIFEAEIDEVIDRAWGNSNGDAGRNEIKNEIFKKIMIRIHHKPACS